MVQSWQFQNLILKMVQWSAYNHFGFDSTYGQYHFVVLLEINTMSP